MNYNSIIKKCLDELIKDNPRKDYVIGMLETLYEMGADKPILVAGEVPALLYTYKPEKTIETLTPIQPKIVNELPPATSLDVVKGLVAKSLE